MGATAGAIKAGRAFVEVFTNDDTKRGLDSAQRRLRFFSRQVGDVGRKMATFSAASLTPVALSVKTFAAFGDQMSKVKAITQASAAEYGMLNAKAKELGRTTSFTASQVAGAMVELGRAGFKPQEIDTAIAGVLNLARATDTELPRAAEIAGAALRGFSLDVDQTDRVIDVLVATANNSAQGMEDIGEAMKMVAPLAVEAGISIEETSAMLGLLANNGIKGTMAGTALARALKNLSTAAAQNALKQVGVDAIDANRNLRPLSTILSELGRKTASLGSADKLAIFETLFGRGQAAALKLAGPQAQFTDLLSTIQKSEGVAKQTAATMDDNLGGAFRMLASAVEGVGIAIGEVLEGDLRELTEFFQSAASATGEWASENRELVNWLVTIIATLGALGVAAMAFSAILTVLSAGVGVLSAAIGVITGLLGFLQAAIINVGAAFLLLQAAFLPLLAITAISVAVFELADAFGLMGEKATSAAEQAERLNRILQIGHEQALRRRRDLQNVSGNPEERAKELRKRVAEQEKVAKSSRAIALAAEREQAAAAKANSGIGQKLKRGALAVVGQDSDEEERLAAADKQLKIAKEQAATEQETLDALRKQQAAVDKALADDKKRTALAANKPRTLEDIERETGIVSRTADVANEIERLSGAATQAEQDLREMWKKGAPPEMLARLKKLIATRDKLLAQKKQEREREQRLQGARQEAQAITEQNRTPAEVLRAEFAKLGKLANTIDPKTGQSLLNGEQLNRAQTAAAEQALADIRAQIQQAQSGADEFTKNASRLSGVDARSSEGLALVAQQSRSSPQRVVAENTKKLIDLEQQVIRLLGKLEKNTKKKPKVSQFRR